METNATKVIDKSKIQAGETKKDKKKRNDKKKDNGLKRPLSAYMLFNNNRRPIIKDEYPSK